MENPKVEAILLAGSVSKNLQDKHSDIELHIFWSTSPTDDDRQHPIEEVKGAILSYEPYEEKEWSEAYITQDGVKFEISSFLSATVEHFISDVIERFDTDYDKQCIVAAVKDGVSLFGQEKIIELKNRVAKYPLYLSERMVFENLWLGNRWNNREAEALLKRQDWLMPYDVICDVQTKTLKIYLKRQGQKNETAAELHIVRQTLYHRLHKIEQLLGPDYMHPENRFMIEFSLHVLRFMP